MSTIKIKKKDFEKLYNIACANCKPKLEEKLISFIFSDTIDFEEGFVSEMEKACTKEQKIVFERIFSKSLSTENSLFQVKNYSDLCKKTKTKELVISDFSFLPKEQQEKALAYHQIQTIEKLYNGDWIKNFRDRNQEKWYPYFDGSGRGLVFLYSSCSYYVFSGLVADFKDEKTSNFVGKTFIDIYKVLAK